MSDFLIRLTDLIKKYESFSSEVYIDDTGHKTIGYGHNLDASFILYPIPLSTEDGDELLQSDIHIVLMWLTKYSWWDALVENRQICLADMAFNLGEAGFKHFVLMIKAVEKADYIEAANQMKHSHWFTQVGQRGRDDYNRMLNG